ncbi:hypothetical protein N332_01239, partial [Mesitornis unicolor]
GEDKPLLPVPPVLAVREHRQVGHAAPGRCGAFETCPKREKQSHDFSVWEER